MDCGRTVNILLQIRQKQAGHAAKKLLTHEFPLIIPIREVTTHFANGTPAPPRNHKEKKKEKRRKKKKGCIHVI